MEVRLAGSQATPFDSVVGMTRHPWNRLLAWIVDWLGVLAWVAIVAAVGIPLYLVGIIGTMPPLWLNLVATVTLVVPVTVVLAGLESSAKEASFGKRARRLNVVSARTGSRMSFRQAIARNALKIALPWTIGHAAVYGIVASSGTGAVPISIWVVTAIAYVLPVAYVVSLFLGTGRTPYDRLCGSVVVTARTDL
jgi:uncharacterized RDD family membrane protein YckC